MDFFTVPTITFGVLYCFFIISHDWRRVLHVNVKQYEGDEGLMECICRAASTPSMLRMTRSSGTKSGLSSWDFLTPVVPLSASSNCPPRADRCGKNASGHHGVINDQNSPF